MRVCTPGRVAVLLVLSALGACSCETDPGLQGRAPLLEVKARLQEQTAYELLPGPKPVAFGAIRAGEEVLAQIELTNSGAADLLLSAAPTLAIGGGAFELRGVLTTACAGVDAHDGSTTLVPGACAALTIAFHPTGIGAQADELLIDSNDAANPALRIPLGGAGTMPDAQVCAETDCSAPGDERITLDFGNVAIGASVQKEVTVHNAGDLPLEISIYSLDPSTATEFKVQPDPAARTVEPGGSVVYTVTFSPLAGGPRTAVLTLPSDDPDQGTLYVDLLGSGDAGHLEVEPFPTLDFGAIEVTTSKTLPFTVRNSGTQPVTLQDVTLLTNGEFVWQAPPPTTPLTMAPGDSFEAAITFTAPDVAGFSARVRFTSDEPSNQTFYLSVTGSGVPAQVCDLKAQVLGLDFGQSVAGQPKRADIVFHNDGYSPCNIPAGGLDIPNGPGVTFRIAAMPPPPIVVGSVGTPSALMRVTVEYIPADTTGPDQATLTATPSNGTPVNVALSGTPVAEGTCQLEVLFPSAGGFFGRTLNFGTVRVLRRKEMNIQIANRGAAPCTITSATKATLFPLPIGDPADFSISSLPGALPYTIPSGGQVAFGVTFRPSGEYVYDAALPQFGIQLQTTDQRYVECAGFGGQGTPGCVQVGLAGSGVTSVLEIVPDRLDFGEVTVGCASRAKEFTVYNLAADGLQVTQIAVDPPNAPFIIVSRPQLPISPFNAGAQFSVTVKYRPPDAQPHSAQVLITTDDGAGNTDVYAVPLNGTGTLDSHQTDTFQVPNSPRTDVLWIVDNSGSMGEEQGELQANAQIFVDLANAQGADYRMAVVTTDTSDSAQNGKFQGNPKIISPTTPNPSATLGSRFDSLGTNGSGDEKGLQAAQTALSDPLISDPAQNGNFLRPDAKLAVIVVSDEEDGSNGDLDFYEDFFWSIKGRRNTGLFTLNAVVGDNPSGCTSGNGDAVAGARYIDMANRTGGIFQSICAQDWGAIANNLGLNVFTPIAEFRLTREAESPSLVVTVNGTRQTQGGGDDYTYDSTSNSIVFNPGREPAAGMTVVVDYDTYCGP